MRDLFSVVEKAHEAVFKLGVKRLVNEIKIDDRRILCLLSTFMIKACYTCNINR